MTKALHYPGADRTSQWAFGRYPGNVMDTNCVILHTTETLGWPSYSTGYYPTLTYHHGARGARWRQHLPINRSARALENRAGGVETNTANVCQIELVGTCDPQYHHKYGGLFWPEAPDEALADLAAFLAWMHNEWGVKLIAPRLWPAYPKSYGNGAGQRMTASQWHDFYGIAGHMHVPENCVHPDTPILCADLIWRRAGDLEVGQELIGFDENLQTLGSTGGRRYRSSVVTRNEPAEKDCYRVATTQGEVVASSDHPWLVRTPYVTRGPRVHWVKTKDLDPTKHRIVSVGQPWEPEDSRIAGWMAGVLDADGHAFAGGRSGSWVGFGQVDGHVLDLFLAECDRRGYQTKVIRRDWEKRGRKITEHPKDFTDVRINRGMWTSLRVLGTLRPVRLFAAAQRMWESAVVGKTTGDVAVLSVQQVGQQPIASLSTSTHTYIADGLLCHNSHGDPGAIDIGRLLVMAERLVHPVAPTPSKPTPKPEDDMPTAADIWGHHINPGPTADRIGGYTPDASYPAADLLVGAEARIRHLEDVTAEMDTKLDAILAKLGDK